MADNTFINDSRKVAITAQTTEIAMHELGESIAASLVSAQQELARYPNSLGSFIIDEMNLEIPISVRVDSLGQVMTTVCNSMPENATVGKLQLKLRPVLGTPQPPPVISDQSLSDLEAFTKEELELLEKQRVFSVNDLFRISRNASGRKELSKIVKSTEVDDLLERAQILAIPNIPPFVRAGLIKAGIKNLSDFAKCSSTKLSRFLSKNLNEKITKVDIDIWKSDVKEYVDLKLPSRKNNIIKPISSYSTYEEEDENV